MRRQVLRHLLTLLGYRRFRVRNWYLLVDSSGQVVVADYLEMFWDQCEQYMDHILPGWRDDADRIAQQAIAAFLAGGAA